MSVVVDTNVAMVASGKSPQADVACVDACVQRLYAITREGGLLIDDRDLILNEYLKNLGYSGQPGPGEKFVKWAYSSQCTPGVVKKIPVTQRTDGGWRRFEEFPDQVSLAAFDRSDQKFVAVAIASGETPPVLVATDRGWWQHEWGLKAVGVIVGFLCPQHAPN